MKHTLHNSKRADLRPRMDEMCYHRHQCNTQKPICKTDRNTPYTVYYMMEGVSFFLQLGLELTPLVCLSMDGWVSDTLTLSGIDLHS